MSQQPRHFLDLWRCDPAALRGMIEDAKRRKAARLGRGHAEVEMMVAPPSWRMPASKEKRVRVEFFWKIIARVLPRAGASASTSA